MQDGAAWFSPRQYGNAAEMNAIASLISIFFPAPVKWDMPAPVARWRENGQFDLAPQPVPL